MGAESETVCVTGASGFIGSWLIMRLLEKGYTVRATVRDPDNIKKVKHLLELPKASTHMTLWKADLSVEGSYDEAIQGCTGVFHVATPMDFESKDPENEVIKPTINGVLDIMKASVHHLLVIAFFISIPLSCTNVALAARHLLHNSKNVPPLPRPKLPPLPPNLTSTPTASVPTLPSPAETFGPPTLSPAPPSISVLTPPNPPKTSPVTVEPPSLPPPTSTSPPKDETFGPPTLSPAPPSISVLTPPNPPETSPVTVEPPSLPPPTSTSPPKDETPPSTSFKSPPLPKPISHKLPPFPKFPPVKSWPMPDPKSFPSIPKFPHLKWPSLPPFHWIPKVPSAGPSNQIHN